MLSEHCTFQGNSFWREGGIPMKQAGAKSFILGILLVILLFSLSITTAHAQWAYTYGGTDRDYAYAVQQTADGGYIVASESYSFGAGDSDFLIIKLDPAGDVTWQKTYGGSSADYPYSIQQTGDGGYIVAGQSQSFSAGDSDILLIKLDNAGNISWQKTYGGSSEDYPIFVQQTTDEGYIVAGSTNSFGAGNYDIWLLKLNSTGDVTWQKTYGGSSYDDWPYWIQQTADGGYIVAGSTYSSDAVREAWLLKLDPAGDVTWQKTYGGSLYDYFFLIQQTTDEGYIVAGSTNSFGAGNYDIWLLKLNSGGDVTWQKTYGGTESDHAYSVQQTTDGGYIVAGNTTSFGAGGYDAWILKLNSNGNVDWQKTYGGSQADGFNSIHQTTDGGYIVAGNTTSFGDGKQDIWLLKLDGTGSIGSCPFERISSAVVTDTNATIVNTNAITGTTSITSVNTAIVVIDANATSSEICPLSDNPLALKTGLTRKRQGEGTMMSLDGLINCPGTCRAEYNQGFDVTLIATAAPLSTFLGWKPTSPGCEGTNLCTVTMDGKKSVKAIFQGPNKLKVVTTFKNGATGTVTSGDALINCPGDCEELYILNAPVTLTANEGVGSSFVKWIGKACKDESTNVCTFEMNKNATVKAIFEPNP